MRNLNQQQAAAALGVSRRTIANWARRNPPCDKQGRLRLYNAEELQAWAESEGLGQIGGDRSLQRGGVAKSPEAREELRALREERRWAALRRETADAEQAERALEVALGLSLIAEEEAERWARCRAEAEAELIGNLPSLVADLAGQGEEDRERIIRDWVWTRLTALSK